MIESNNVLFCYQRIKIIIFILYTLKIVIILLQDPLLL